MVEKCGKKGLTWKMKHIAQKGSNTLLGLLKEENEMVLWSMVTHVNCQENVVFVYFFCFKLICIVGLVAFQFLYFSFAFNLI